MANENQKELTRILAEPNRRTETFKSSGGKRRHEIIPEAQSIGLDTVVRRPLPILGGTFEKFAVSNEYLDDQRAETVKAAYLPNESSIMYENATRFRNISGQAYDTETLTEELLESLRPKYDLLIPHTLLNARTKSELVSEERDAMEEGYRVMYRAASNLNCEFRETDQQGGGGAEETETLPEIALMDSIAHMEQRLRIPEFAKLSVMHPQTAIRAVEESMNLTAAARDSGRNIIDMRQIKDAEADFNELGKYFISSDQSKTEIPAKLLNQLNLITPRSTYRSDSRMSFNDDNRISNKLQNAGELVQKSMAKLLGHPDTPAALSTEDPRIIDGSIIKKAHEVYEITENTNTFTVDTGGRLRPLPANENPLFIYPLAPNESWEFCHLVNEVNPCGELKLRHAPKIIEMLAERSIDDILKDLDEARHAHFLEIRLEKERILAAKIAEAVQQEREFEAELLTRRKLDVKATAQAKAAEAEATKSLLSVQDIMRPLDEATALLDEAEAATFGDEGILGGDTVAHLRESPAALKKRLELEKLADARNAHYNSFSNWHSQHIVPVLNSEKELSTGQCNVRAFVRHLQKIYEMEIELQPLLSWSETDEPDLTGRMMKETKPDFSDVEVIKRLIKEDREESLRAETREILKCLLHLPRVYYKASNRLSRPSLDNVFCTKILYQGIIWQPTFQSHRGFVWAVAYETALVLYHIPSSTAVTSLGFPTVAAKSIDGSIVAILPLADATVTLRGNQELAGIYNASMKDRGVIRRNTDRSDKFESRFSKMFSFASADISAQGRGLVNFRFTTSPDEPIFSAWVLALTHACAYTHHCKRVGSPWPNVQSCLTTLDSSTLDLSSRQFNVEEVAQILRNLDMRAMTEDHTEPLRNLQVGIKSVDLRACDLVASDIARLANLFPDTFIKGWFLAGNPKLGDCDPNELLTKGILQLSKDLRELDLSECELRDSAELGRLMAELIFTHPELVLLNLQNNTLGAKFIHGMTSFFKDRLNEKQVSPPVIEQVSKAPVSKSGRLSLHQRPLVQATDLLLSNNALNNASAAELVAIVEQLNMIGYLNVNGCALIQHGFLAKLMEKHPKLLLRSDERSNATSTSLSAVCQVASKSNTLRLYLLPWQRSLTGPLHIEEVRFPTGLLSSLVQKVAQQKRCYTVRLRQCAGDMFMAHDLTLAFNTPTYKFRVLDLSYSDWYSPETQKSAEEYYVAQGSMSIDGRLLNVLETTQAFNVRELTLAHTAAFDGSVFEAKHVAEFLFKLITQSDLEVLDLTGCDVGEDAFRILCQLLATKRTSDEVRDAFYLDEHNTHLITETWQRTSLLQKKQLRIAAKLNMITGGIKRQWAIRMISLDHCTRISQRQIELFVKLLIQKAPLLYILSIAEVMNKSWGSLESWKIPGFDPRMIQGATADGLPKPTEGDSLKIPTEPVTDELINIKNYLLMSRLYVDSRNRLRRFDVSSEEALKEKNQVIQNWMIKLEESKTHQRTARRRLRKRQLQKFFLNCQKRALKTNRISKRMPSTVEILRDDRVYRISRRQERIGCSILNDGIFPPYRLPSNLLLDMHQAKDGIYRPGLEFEKFLTRSTERILDLSCCYYDSYLMEDFIAQIVEREPSNRSAHLEAIKLVNCGFDSAHAIDLAQIVGFYEIRCDNLDFSINQLDADRSIFREALITIIINLQVRALTLDCNLFMDSKNLAEIIIMAITKGLCEVISVRHNELGKVFIKHFIKKCDEILLESLERARKIKVPKKTEALKTTLAADLGGKASKVLVGTAAGASPERSQQLKKNDVELPPLRTNLAQMRGIHKASPTSSDSSDDSARGLPNKKPGKLPGKLALQKFPSKLNTQKLPPQLMKLKAPKQPLIKNPPAPPPPPPPSSSPPPPSSLAKKVDQLSSKPRRKTRFALDDSDSAPSNSPSSSESSPAKKNDSVPVSKKEPMKDVKAETTAINPPPKTAQQQPSDSPSRSSDTSSSSSSSDDSSETVDLNKNPSAEHMENVKDALNRTKGSTTTIPEAKEPEPEPEPLDPEYEAIRPKPRAKTCLKRLATIKRQHDLLPDETADDVDREPTQFVRKYIARRSDLKHMLKVLDLRSNPDLPAADLLLLTTKLQLICPHLVEVRIDEHNMSGQAEDIDLTRDHLQSLKHPTFPGVFPEEPASFFNELELMPPPDAAETIKARKTALMELIKLSESKAHTTPKVEKTEPEKSTPESEQPPKSESKGSTPLSAKTSVKKAKEKFKMSKAKFDAKRHMPKDKSSPARKVSPKSADSIARDLKPSSPDAKPAGKVMKPGLKTKTSPDRSKSNLKSARTSDSGAKKKIGTKLAKNVKPAKVKKPSKKSSKSA